MLIAARESFAAAARKRLPYDAEVEYLERPAGATAYIKLPHVTKGDSMTTTVRVWLNTPDASKQNYIVTGSIRWEERAYMLTYPGGEKKVRANYYDTSRIASVGLTQQAWHTLVIAPTGYWQDGTKQLSWTAVTFEGKLLAVMNHYSPDTLAGGDCGTNVLRMAYAKVQDGNTLVSDLQPVRVGSGANAVGYMYDRVSGQLFGKSGGTGAFAVGPDKTA